MEDAGLHVIVDARVRDVSVFSREGLERLFAELMTALEMKPLDRPMIYEVPVDPEVLERVRETGKFEDEGGITGIQVISTSHLSVDAWPLQRFFSLDALSCKTFNVDRALGVIRDVMGVESENVQVVKQYKPAMMC